MSISACMKKLVIYIIVLAFMGCATPLSKQKFPRDNVKDITVGKTTQRDVYDTFGEPIYHGSKTDDESWWMYIHTTKDNSESLSLYFDKEGRVTDFLYTPFEKSLKEKLQASR